jgi:hypothetical protein
MTATNNNTAETFQFGKEAARLWGLSIERGEAGDANAIMALVHAQRTVNFDATVERKDTETVERFEFDILSFAEPYWNNDGSKDTRKMAARTACLAERLFGISELTNAIKQRLARSLKCAIYVLNSLKDMDDEQLFAAVTLKGNKLVVPNELVRAEPSETASENEKAIYQAMKGRPLILDGKDKASLAELSRRANPPKQTARDGKDNNTSGASFVNSVKFVTAIVQQQLSEDAPENAVSDVALSDEARRDLFKLAQYIAAYFTADPLEEVEEAPKEEKKAA